MNNILFYISSVLFGLTVFANALSFLNIFENRDYNAQRLLIYLRETRRGKNLIYGKVAILKWIAIFAYIFTIFIEFDTYYHLLVFALYFVLLLNLLRHIKNKDFVLPAFGRNISVAVGLTVLVEVGLFTLAPVDPYLWLLLLDKLMLVFLSFFLILISVFSDFTRDQTINRAIAKIATHSKLLSIAVVGSYGRGSTKEFISRVLSTKYNVLTEHSSFNNSLGIAKTINSSLTSKSQIFIAEINDYSRSDVAEMCALIKPKIVVVAGINEQKISLFKTIENILLSKLEAVESLTRDGIALFNGNSDYAKDLYKKTKKKKFIYQLYGKNEGVAISATNVKVSKFSLSFDVHMNGKKYKIANVKLLGRQNIENLLPAIFIGIYAHVDFAKVKQVFDGITPLVASMEPFRGRSGAVLINDTHNANINSVLRALSYAKLYRGKKVLILEPLVELGKNASKILRDLGEEIGKVCDIVFLTNDNYYPAISVGITEVNSDCEIAVLTPAKIIDYVKNESKREDVIIFEGHEAALSFTKIPKEKIYGEIENSQANKQ